MPDLKRIYQIPEEDRSPEEAEAVTAAEVARWGASFDAWRLASRAARAESAEVEALWDATMEAFEGIATTPVDPGNDGGPFVEVARAMDARRVRQALAIVERMAATPGWIYRLNGSRATLASRLAELGHREEARGWLDRLDPRDDFYSLSSTPKLPHRGVLPKARSRGC